MRLKMIKVNQRIKHDPDNGVYGDCMRACIASLLEYKYEEVPHFYTVDDAEEFDKKLREFLQQEGFALMTTVPIDIDDGAFTHGQNGIYHIISGNTVRGTYHATVGLDGVVVHDPHESKAGLIEDDEKTFSFLIKI